MLPVSTKSRRIAFITYTEKTSMYGALAVKNPDFRGSEISLTEALPKGQRGGYAATPASGSNTRLFINDIPKGTTSEHLKQYFSQWGNVADVFFTESRAFGFITFANEPDMMKCLGARPLIFQGSELKAEIARPKPPTSSREAPVASRYPQRVSIYDTGAYAGGFVPGRGGHTRYSPHVPTPSSLLLLCFFQVIGLDAHDVCPCSRLGRRRSSSPTLACLWPT